RSTLADVRAAVSDWPKVRELSAPGADRVEGAEGAELLRWLGSGMSTQLGHVTQHRHGRPSQGLGVCRKSASDLLSDSSCKRAFQWFDKPHDDGRGEPPLIVKSNLISQVHRRVPIDLFIVPVTEQGKIAALSIHAGIWTSAAMNAPP